MQGLRSWACRSAAPTFHRSLSVVKGSQRFSTQPHLRAPRLLTAFDDRFYGRRRDDYVSFSIYSSSVVTPALFVRRGMSHHSFFIARSFHTSVPRNMIDPYKVLGVGKTSTAKEIKLAYFKLAKKYHPDMNPNDPVAKRKFQEVSQAFDILKDDQKRRDYDQQASSSWWGGDSQQQNQQHSQQSQYTQQQAQQQWDDIATDADVIQEALNEYLEHLKEDALEAIEGVNNGDLKPTWNFASQHRTFFVLVILPLVVVLRFPSLALAALRFGGVVVSRFIVPALVFFDHRGQLFRHIWTLLVHARRSVRTVAESYTESRKLEKSQKNKKSSSQSHHRQSEKSQNSKRGGRRSRHFK